MGQYPSVYRKEFSDLPHQNEVLPTGSLMFGSCSRTASRRSRRSWTSRRTRSSRRSGTRTQGPPSCEDGSTPECPGGCDDGSAPDFSSRPPCADESRPNMSVCVCEDGSSPRPPRPPRGPRPGREGFHKENQQSSLMKIDDKYDL